MSFALLVTTDTRDEAADKTTPLVRRLIEAAGHHLRATARVANDPVVIAEGARGFLSRSEIDALVVSGGTGFSSRDVSVDALKPLVTRDAPGFGELFRQLSFAEVGSAALLSRAFAGAVGRDVLFVLPGSPKAVQLAFERLILPEVGHWLGQLRSGPAR